jgi:hypothetical protein
VFNGAMLLRPVLVAALAAAALAAPASAGAAVVEVGHTEAAPACPTSPCLAVSRTTGYQVKVGDKRGAFTVPADGKIVAWSISLGRPTAAQSAFFDKNLGGPSSARITILRAGTKLFSRVVTQSPIQALKPYFGQTVQFPLAQSLNVRKGYVVAVTVPTWAPALTQLLADGSAWRASRPLTGCNDTGEQTAQMALGALTQYRCLYKARLAYSATLVTTPRQTGRATAVRARARGVPAT